MNIYIWLIVNIVNNSLTCGEKSWFVYIRNKAWQARKDVNPQNEKSQICVNPQNSVTASSTCVSSLCGNATRTPLTHGSDDILKSDLQHGCPFGLQCCLQLAQRLGPLCSVPDSPVKPVSDILNWREVRWQRWPWHNFQVLCSEKIYTGTCWMGPGVVLREDSYPRVVVNEGYDNLLKNLISVVHCRHSSDLRISSDPFIRGVSIALHCRTRGYTRYWQWLSSEDWHWFATFHFEGWHLCALVTLYCVCRRSQVFRHRSMNC